MNAQHCLSHFLVCDSSYSSLIVSIGMFSRRLASATAALDRIFDLDIIGRTGGSDCNGRLKFDELPKKQWWIHNCDVFDIPKHQSFASEFARRLCPLIEPSHHAAAYYTFPMACCWGVDSTLKLYHATVSAISQQKEHPQRRPSKTPS